MSIFIAPQDIRQTKPEQLTAVFEPIIWRDKLPARQRALFNQIKAINDDTSLSLAERTEHYRDMFAGWSDKQRYDALTIWNKWLRFKRIMHAQGQRNSIRERIEKHDYAGQSVQGAMLRATTVGSNGHRSVRINPLDSTRLHDKVLPRKIFVQPTPHPTDAADANFTISDQNFNFAIIDYAKTPDPDKLPHLERVVETFLAAPDVIRRVPRTALEEADEEFAFIANGLLAGVTVGSHVYDSAQDLSSKYDGINLFAPGKPRQAFINTGMGGWGGDDADGSPMRTAAVSRDAVEGDFDRIRYFIIDELVNLKAASNYKQRFDRLITQLESGELSYANDKTGLALTQALSDAADNEEPAVRARLKQLSTITQSHGWYWRRRDARQSSDVHADMVRWMESLAPGEDLEDSLRQAMAAASGTPLAEKLKGFKTKPGIMLESFLRLRVIKDHPDAFRQYIISNYAGAEDAHNLYKILSAYGVEAGLQMTFLHETGADLQNAPRYIRNLSEQDWFEDYLQKNNYTFTFKVAMSDSQRESGPGAYFHQIHGLINSFIELMEVNRERALRGLPPIKMDVQWGGAFDMIRGGNDISNLLYEFSRGVVGAAHLHGFTFEDVQAALGYNFGLTIQGRDRVIALGNEKSAEEMMERLSAAAINATEFLTREHSPEDLALYAKKYAANAEGAALIIATLTPEYHNLRGALLNDIGFFLTPAEALRSINDSCRPNTRPTVDEDAGAVDLERLFGISLTNTRAITSMGAGELNNTEVTGWYGFDKLSTIPLATRHQLYQDSSQFRDFLFRPLIILARNALELNWQKPEFIGLQPDFKTANCYANQLEKSLIAYRAAHPRDEGNIYLADAELDSVIADVAAQVGLDNTKQSRNIIELCWLEKKKRAAEAALCETILGSELGHNFRASELFEMLPENAAARRIADELADMKQTAEPFKIWLADLSQESKGQFTERKDYTAHNWQEKLCAFGILGANQTPAAFLDWTPGEGELHLQKCKRLLQKAFLPHRKAIALTLLPLAA